MDDKVLTLSKLTAEDRAIYMRLVMSLRWREQVEKYNELGANVEDGYDAQRWFYMIRGLFFHYDQKRAKRIQNFLNDMQLKYDCDSIDRKTFPGSEDRWQ
jgi:hypothetical protein